MYIQEPLTDNGQWTKSRCFQRRFEFKRGTLLFGGKQRLKGKWIFFFLITNLEVVTSARIVNRRGSNVYIISFVPLTRIGFRWRSFRFDCVLFYGEMVSYDAKFFSQVKNLLLVSETKRIKVKSRKLYNSPKQRLHLDHLSQPISNLENLVWKAAKSTRENSFKSNKRSFNKLFILGINEHRPTFPRKNPLEHGQLAINPCQTSP